jgi:hypothetical protein
MTRKQHNFSLELASRAHTFCTVNKEKQMMTYRKNTAQRKLLGAAPQIRQGALKSNRKTCFSSSQELDVTCVHKLSPPRVEGTAAGAPPEPGGGGSGGIKLGWVLVSGGGGGRWGRMRLVARPLGLLGVREEEGTWKKMSGCVDRWINIQRMENVTDEKIFFTPFISLMKFI